MFRPIGICDISYITRFVSALKAQQTIYLLLTSLPKDRNCLYRECSYVERR